jgi:hypothetical protein
MINIATVHFQSDRWIDIQLKYLHKFIKPDFRIYACLPEPKEKFESRFYFTSEYEPPDKLSEAPNINHAKKLNYLADIILNDSDGDDYLIFIDGDAFPIADLSPFIDRILGQYFLAAVRRDENGGDIQPHPCFCATTTQFWKEIQGDWSPGFTWKNSAGMDMTDVGGNLLGALLKRAIPWYPMLRSNTLNLHRLWFGIYDGLVYHHGAGFRPAVSRIDELTNNQGGAEFFGSPQYFENLKIIDQVYKNIQNNEQFYLEF